MSPSCSIYKLAKLKKELRQTGRLLKVTLELVKKKAVTCTREDIFSEADANAQAQEVLRWRKELKEKGTIHEIATSKS